MTRAELPGRSAVLRAHLHGHPQRFDELLQHLPDLVTDPHTPVVRWWFWRHHDRARPDGDQHLVLCLRLRTATDYPAAAARLADWAVTLRDAGLLADLSHHPHRPATTDHAHDELLEEVLATDSAAALTQMSWVARTGLPRQAITAMSLTELATALAATPRDGLRMLLDNLPREHGKLDPNLSSTALAMITADGQPSPPAAAIARAWARRHTALTTYHDQFTPDRKTGTRLMLQTLLHEHHLRAVSVDPGVEKVTNRLARAVAQRRLALSQHSGS